MNPQANQPQEAMNQQQQVAAGAIDELAQIRRASNERVRFLADSDEVISATEMDKILAVHAVAAQEPLDRRDNEFFIDFTFNTAKALGALKYSSEKTKRRYDPIKKACDQVRQTDAKAADSIFAALSAALPQSSEAFDACVPEHVAMKERIQADGIDSGDFENEKWSNYAKTAMNLSFALRNLDFEDITPERLACVEEAGKYITSQEERKAFNDNIKDMQEIIIDQKRIDKAYSNYHYNQENIGEWSKAISSAPLRPSRPKKTVRFGESTVVEPQSKTGQPEQVGQSSAESSKGTIVVMSLPEQDDKRRIWDAINPGDRFSSVQSFAHDVVFYDLSGSIADQQPDLDQLKQNTTDEFAKAMLQRYGFVKGVHYVDERTQQKDERQSGGAFAPQQAHDRQVRDPQPGALQSYGSYSRPPTQTYDDFATGSRQALPSSSVQSPYWQRNGGEQLEDTQTTTRPDAPRGGYGAVQQAQPAATPATAAPGLSGTQGGASSELRRSSRKPKPIKKLIAKLFKRGDRDDRSGSRNSRT